MQFKQFYLGCLAQASYYLGSNNEAAIIDPQRDIDHYIQEAEVNGQKIKYVIETHVHADFVSGHKELAQKTGAKIVFGAKAKPQFEFLPVADGDVLKVGEIELKIMETPGHTPESISILATDNSGEPAKLFTGDTLFIGDVGRPDLIGTKGFTAEQMASMLYDSLHDKILKLSDKTEVYPAHGAGSLCGRNLSRETMSTIGEQRKFNYALKPMTKEEFIRAVTDNQPEVPQYFSKDVAMNLQGGVSLEDLPAPRASSPAEVKRLQAEGAIVLDVRSAAEYGTGNVPGSLNIALSGQFASWAGTFIAHETPIVIVSADEEQVAEAQMRLARVGIESLAGYLDGGILAWQDAGYEVGEVPQMPVDELKARLDENADLQIVDVRRAPEYAGGHAPKAKNVPLAELEKHLAEFDRSRPTAVICQSGYRSSLGTGILAKNGFSEVYNVVGGTGAWIGSHYEVETEAANTVGV